MAQIWLIKVLATFPLGESQAFVYVGIVESHFRGIIACTNIAKFGTPVEIVIFFIFGSYATFLHHLRLYWREGKKIVFKRSLSDESAKLKAERQSKKV